MRLYAFLSLFLLAVALVEAAPKSIEKKSLAEDTKLEKKSDLKIEETGKEKDRAKKSAASFIVEIKPSPNQAGVPSGDCKDGQSAQLNVVPMSSSPSASVQTVSVVQPATQPVQTLSVVQPAPQPVQTLSVAQPVAQSSSIVLPAQQPPATVQPVHTLHILQSVPQPCAQPTQTVSIVQPPQPAPQPATLNIIQAPTRIEPKPIAKPAPKPEPAPEPAPQPEMERIVEVVKPEPQESTPSQIVNIIRPAQPLPEVQPAEVPLNVVSLEPECEEEVVFMPSTSVMLMSQPEPQPQYAALVKVPTAHQCYHQQQALLTECDCHPKNLALVSALSPASQPASDKHNPSFKTHHHHYHTERITPVPFIAYASSIPSITSIPSLPSAPVSVYPQRPQMLVQYNPVQSPVNLRASNQAKGDSIEGKTGAASQGRTSTVINLNTGSHPGHLPHMHHHYGVKGYMNSLLPHGIAINSYPYGAGVQYMGPHYRQSTVTYGDSQSPGVTIQESPMTAGASEAIDMLQAMSGKKVPRETDPNILAAQEAAEGIKEITEQNIENSNSSVRNSRSDTELKKDVTESS